jgi:hypothetical protein
MTTDKDEVSRFKAGSSHGDAWPWRIPRDGHVVETCSRWRRDVKSNVGYAVIARL